MNNDVDKTLWETIDKGEQIVINDNEIKQDEREDIDGIYMPRE